MEEMFEEMIFSQCLMYEQKHNFNQSNKIQALSYECYKCRRGGGKYFHSKSQKCYECPNNCYYCNQLSECLQCFPGFQVVNNLCLLSELISKQNQLLSNSYCLLCDCTKFNQSKECLNCGQYCQNQNKLSYERQNYSLISLQNQKQRILSPSEIGCTPLNSGCSKCYSSGRLLQKQNQRNLASNILCSECNPGYYLFNYSQFCIYCGTNCSNCQTSGCIECNYGFGLQQVNSLLVCTNCNGNYDPQLKTCVSCASNCSTCDKANSCSTCDQGYFIKLNQQNNLNECVLCSESGFFADQTTLECVKCLANCLTCNQNNSCLSCSNGYYLLSVSDTQQCVNCNQPGQYGDSITQNCIICSNNCITCNSTNNCLLCAQGFYSLTIGNLSQCVLCDQPGQIVNSQTSICLQCGSNCQTCNSSNNCLSCASGYFLLTVNSVNQCVLCDQLGQFKNLNTQNCILCDSNCQTCNSSNSCLSCAQGYFMLTVNNINQCVLCDQSGQYGNPYTQNCMLCGNNCQTCNSSNDCLSCIQGQFLLTVNNVNQCVLCNQPGQFADSGSQTCIVCANNCLTCSSSNNCLQCTTGYFEKIVNNVKQCVLCDQPGEYGNLMTQRCIQCSNNCLSCDSTSLCTSCTPGYYFLTVAGLNSCVTCNDQGYFKQIMQQKCIKCSDNCLTCDQNSSCTQCQQSYYKIADNTLKIKCQTCHSDCISCNGSTNQDCIQCGNSKYIDQINKVCVVCDTQNNYIQGNYCIKCDQSCLGCNGTTNQDCFACNQGYYKDQNNYCLPCKSSTLDPIKVSILTSRCQNLDYKCQLNPISNDYENRPICLRCNNNYILSDDSCQNSCEDIGDNLQYDNNLNKCVCKSAFPYYHISGQDNKFCSKIIADGFFCNTNNICKKCSNNCVKCKSNSECLQCGKDYFFWQSKCLVSCLDNMISIYDSSNNQNICDCEQGYFYNAQINQCIQTLRVVSIKKYYDKTNILIFQLNRVPLQDELQNLNLVIDQQKLTQGIEYKIISQSILNDQIIFEISVQNNRQISTLELSSSQLNFHFKVKNTILMRDGQNQSEKYTGNSISKMNSISQSLTSQTESQKTLIQFMKYFQLFCFLSNFLQIFGAFIIFQQYLPKQLQDCFIYGASFLFERVPSSEDLNIQQINQNQVDQSAQVFNNLGLYSNLFKNCTVIHILILLTVIIVTLCTIARNLMKGKQYTIQIVDFLINQMSQFQQGFITITLFSIYNSIISSSTSGFAINQLVFNIFFITQLSIRVCQKDGEYVMNKIPNLVINLQTQMKGWNTYIILSYLKKYTCIMIILIFQKKPKQIAITQSAIFFCFSIYLIYFRFFENKFFIIYKSFQEFFIAITFILLFFSISYYDGILEKEIIEDSELNKLDLLCLITIILFQLCLILSTTLFLVRTTIKIIVSYHQVIDYFKKRNNTTSMANESLDLLMSSKKIQLSNITTFSFKNNRAKQKNIELESNLENQ